MSDEVLRQVCGVIMPISAIDGCTENHWTEVFQIITDSIKDAGFEANIVSNADDVGIIQKRIIQNLYDNPIVVCDVSGKNPNVMFELGLRLAFDKPTIIIKDDKTSYSFDTATIEHLEYPRDLRFSKITDFKKKLTEKIIATHNKATNDPDNYTTFLKHFGEFKVAKIDQKEVSGQEFIIDELKNIRLAISKAEKSRLIRDDALLKNMDRGISINLSNENEYVINNILTWVKNHSEVSGWGFDINSNLVVQLTQDSHINPREFRMALVNMISIYNSHPRPDQVGFGQNIESID